MLCCVTMFLCCAKEQTDNLNRYVSQITCACMSSAITKIPPTRHWQRAEQGGIPGWTEFVAPFKTNSIFGTISGRTVAGPTRVWSQT